MLSLITGKNMAAARRIRIAVAIFFFISGFTFSSWASRIPTLQEKLHLNDAQLGTVLFALPMGLILTLPFTSMLLGRVSSRYVMLAGALLYAVLLPALGLVNEVWQLLALLFLFGSSRNFLNIAINAQSVGVQAMYSRSIITTFHGIWSVAGFAGAALGSLMISLKISPFFHFTLVGVLSLVMTMMAYGDALQEDNNASKKKTLLALPDKPLMKLGLIAFGSMVCEGTMYDWSGIYFQKEIHVSDEYIGMGYAAYMCTMATGRFVGDRMVNKYGVKRMLQVCGCLIAAGLLLSVVLPLVSTGLAGFMLTGFGVSCVVPLVFSVTGKNTKMAAGPAIAAVSVIGYLGFLLGPPLIGYISQAVNLRLAFALVAILGFSITLLAGKIADNNG
ncbi:Fucose permease [Filimonas lacunae]|uniref:Fucose permease n=1 Tax=Filimonas lacunae TaxID=477680 RepID=A0A173MM86_9BACT|nr:MFS transporter [Filimonas lacunae]BAV08763.1 major facilitator superfamily MFS_1 [Filimonas lacunae]SIS61328.1 Fucose permease [Filimonas lacunae]